MRATMRQVTTYRNDDPDGEVPDRTLAERRAHAVVAAQPADDDLAWLRTLVYALRPDVIDKANPPPREAITVAGAVRTPAAPWDRLYPSGPGSNTATVCDALASGSVAEEERREHASKVFRKLARLDEASRRVLLWLRDNAKLADGSRGVFFDLGVAAAPWAAPEGAVLAWATDHDAKRTGAPVLGRRLAFGARRAWEGER